MMNAKSLPRLLDVLRATAGSALAAVLVCRAGRTISLPAPYLRGLSVALAYLWMKLSGFVYPPGGPLALVFVDKAAELDKKLGLAYGVMAGVSGTLVLMAIAALKIRIVERLKDTP